MVAAILTLCLGYFFEGHNRFVRPKVEGRYFVALPAAAGVAAMALYPSLYVVIFGVLLIISHTVLIVPGIIRGLNGTYDDGDDPPR
jgi:uncharacterized membrane protein YjjP (DUF1212 family)